MFFSPCPFMGKQMAAAGRAVGEPSARLLAGAEPAEFLLDFIELSLRVSELHHQSRNLNWIELCWECRVLLIVLGLPQLQQPHGKQAFPQGLAAPKQVPPCLKTFWIIASSRQCQEPPSHPLWAALVLLFLIYTFACLQFSSENGEVGWSWSLLSLFPQNCNPRHCSPVVRRGRQQSSS